MDGFSIFNSLASSTLFASTTGIMLTQISSFATSSVLSVFGYSPFVFLYHNISGIIGYALIAGVLIVPIGALSYYKLMM